ncbi:MAG: hypothetical protein M1825_004642 [Sarcosagium campestre]|nr:MAG: hypothetical protein M1825_004642 [Sarcosagium campestre]
MRALRCLLSCAVAAAFFFGVLEAGSAFSSCTEAEHCGYLDLGFRNLKMITDPAPSEMDSENISLCHPPNGHLQKLGDKLRVRAKKLEQGARVVKDMTILPTDEMHLYFEMTVNGPRDDSGSTPNSNVFIEPELLEKLADGIMKTAAVTGQCSFSGEIFDDRTLFSFQILESGPQALPLGRLQQLREARDTMIGGDRVRGSIQPTDLLLFVGNTAAYIYYTFPQSPFHQEHLVPYFSSAFTFDDEDISTLLFNVDQYRQHVLGPIKRASENEDVDRIIVISTENREDDGKGIDFFLELLDVGLPDEYDENSNRLTQDYQGRVSPSEMHNLPYPPDEDWVDDYVHWRHADVPVLFMRIEAAEAGGAIQPQNVRLAPYLSPLVIGDEPRDFTYFDKAVPGRLLPEYSIDDWPYLWTTMNYPGKSEREILVWLLRTGNRIGRPPTYPALQNFPA